MAAGRLLGLVATEGGASASRLHCVFRFFQDPDKEVTGVLRQSVVAQLRPRPRPPANRELSNRTFRGPRKPHLWSVRSEGSRVAPVRRLRRLPYAWFPRSCFSMDVKAERSQRSSRALGQRALSNLCGLVCDQRRISNQWPAGAPREGLPGTVQVSGPYETMRGVFLAPCDFSHLRLADWHLAELSEKMPSALSGGSNLSRVSGFRRDRAIEQLARAILEAQTASGDLNTAFVDGIANSILIRLLGMEPSPGGEMPTSRVPPIAKWRLNRVTEFIDANLDGPIKLVDMAAAAGLT